MDLFQSDDLDAIFNFTSTDSSNLNSGPRLEENHELLGFDPSQLLSGSGTDSITPELLGEHVENKMGSHIGNMKQEHEFQQPLPQKKTTFSQGTFEEELYNTHRRQSGEERFNLSHSMNVVPQKGGDRDSPRGGGMSDFPVKRRKSEPNIRAPMTTTGATTYAQGESGMGVMSPTSPTHQEPPPMDRRSSFALTSDPIFMDPSNANIPERRNSITSGGLYGAPPTRRNSISQSPPPPPGGRREFDPLWAKSKLLDMLYGEKQIEPFCAQVINFICNYTKMHVAGFYLNLQKQWNPKEWSLSYAYPSVSVFSKFFHFTLGCRQIMQAALEKRCFCVHNTQLKNNDSLSFMFVPLPSEEGRKFSLGVMVLGTILHGEQDLHSHLLFLDQIRRAIYVPFLTILSLQEKGNLVQGLDVLVAENQILKKRNRFERALVSLLAATENTYGKAVSIICSNTSGLITYLSPGSEALLGYTASELVGAHNLLKVHSPQEIMQRAKDLEAELGKRVIPGLGVIVERTMRNRGKEDSRIWTYIRKDGTATQVRVIIKPLHDDKSIFGFVEIATEVENMDMSSSDFSIDPNQFFNTQGSYDIPGTSTTTMATPDLVPQSPMTSGLTPLFNQHQQHQQHLQHQEHHQQHDHQVPGDAPPATPNSVNDLMKSLLEEDQLPEMWF